MHSMGTLAVPNRLQASCFRVLGRTGIRIFPRDEALATRFRQNKVAFDEIRGMLAIDAHLGYVGALRTRVIGENRWRSEQDPGIPPERWGRYRSLLRRIGAEAVSHVGEAITIRVSTTGRASKGFVYNPSNRVLVSSLDQYPLLPEKHAHRLLEGSWHLYLGWE